MGATGSIVRETLGFDHLALSGIRPVYSVRDVPGLYRCTTPPPSPSIRILKDLVDSSPGISPSIPVIRSVSSVLISDKFLLFRSPDARSPDPRSRFPPPPRSSHTIPDWRGIHGCSLPLQLLSKIIVVSDKHWFFSPSSAPSVVDGPGFG